MYSHSHGDIYKNVGGGLTGEPQKSTAAEWECIQWDTTQHQRWKIVAAITTCMKRHNVSWGKEAKFKRLHFNMLSFT